MLCHLPSQPPPAARPSYGQRRWRRQHSAQGLFLCRTQSTGFIVCNPYSQATHTQQRPVHPEPTSSVLTRTAAPAYSCYVRPAASHGANSFLAHLRAMVGCCSPSLGNKDLSRERLLHSSFPGEITPCPIVSQLETTQSLPLGCFQITHHP